MPDEDELLAPLPTFEECDAAIKAGRATILHKLVEVTYRIPAAEGEEMRALLQEAEEEQARKRAAIQHGADQAVRILEKTIENLSSPIQF